MSAFEDELKERTIRNVERLDKHRVKIKALESDMKELKEDLIKKFETLLEDIGDSTILPNLTKLMEAKQ